MCGIYRIKRKLTSCKYELVRNTYELGGGDHIRTDHLIKKKIRKGYLVVNTRTGIHTHVRSEYGCYCLLLFIEKDIEPENSYLKESKRRLMMEKPDYKDRYYNVNKGCNKEPWL